MTVTLASLADTLLQRAGQSERFLVAIAGPPGAGKSTLADALRDALLQRNETVEVLPMDGFHMDNGLLQARGLLARKGAPETFDVRGFADVVDAVREAKDEVLVPVFDRSRELAIASARAIAQDTRFVLIEGNYLLLNEEPWAQLAPRFDLKIFVGPSFAVLQDRLRNRWLGYGLDEKAIGEKLEGNDLPNGRRVIENSGPADISIDMWV